MNSNQPEPEKGDGVVVDKPNKKVSSPRRRKKQKSAKMVSEMIRRLQKTGNSKALLLTTPMLQHIGGDADTDKVSVVFRKGEIAIQFPHPDAEAQTVRRKKGSTATVVRVPFAVES